MDKRLSYSDRLRYSLLPSKYKNFLKDGLGNAIIFIVIIGVFCGVINGFTYQKAYNQGLTEIKNIIKDNKYKFTFNDNILNVESSPLVAESTGVFTLYIDTTKSVNDYEEMRGKIVHTDMGSAITKDGVILNGDFIFTPEMMKAYFNISDNGVIKFSELKNATIPIATGIVDIKNNEDLMKMVESYSIYGYLLFFIMIFVSLLGIIMDAIVLFLVGLFSDKINGTKLGYINILKFSIYALTIPLLLQWIIPLSYTVLIVGTFMVVMAIARIRMENTINEI